MIYPSTPFDSASAVSRRSFFKHAGLSGAATAALGASAFLSTAHQAEAARTAVRDVDVLNFALNLEYLEAEFYLRAFKGTGLEAEAPGAGEADLISGSGGAPGAVTVKANPQVTFANSLVASYAREIALDETAHVRALRATIRQLGGAPVSRPPIDLLNSFNTAANAAGIAPTFDPFANDVNFLLGAFVFEDVGVTAYKGASPLVATKGVLEAAAGILAVEAYHAGIIRTSLFSMAPTAMNDIAVNVQKISDLRDALDGPDDLDQGIFDALGNGNLVPTDANGIAFSRSPRQVLNIVYGAVNATQGLFFPSGMRGAIK